MPMTQSFETLFKLCRQSIGHTVQLVEIIFKGPISFTEDSVKRIDMIKLFFGTLKELIFFKF